MAPLDLARPASLADAPPPAPPAPSFPPPSVLDRVGQQKAKIGGHASYRFLCRLHRDHSTHPDRSTLSRRRQAGQSSAARSSPLAARRCLSAHPATRPAQPGSPWAWSLFPPRPRVARAPHLAPPAMLLRSVLRAASGAAAHSPIEAITLTFTIVTLVYFQLLHAVRDSALWVQEG